MTRFKCEDEKEEVGRKSEDKNVRVRSVNKKMGIQMGFFLPSPIANRSKTAMVKEVENPNRRPKRAILNIANKRHFLLNNDLMPCPKINQP